MNVIVIDNGTGFCKAGFAGDSFPKVEFPSVVGLPRYTPVVAGLDYRDFYVGGSAQARRGILSLSYPIRQGIVHDWDKLITLWHHTFHHLLEVKPSECAVIVSEAPKNPLRNRELMMEILFDHFGFKGAFVAIQAVLALYTTGHTTGIVLDSGDGVSHAVPVYEGYAIHHAMSRLEFAGRTLTDYLISLLTQRGYYFTSTAEVEIARDIKEKLCFVSKDFRAEYKRSRMDSSRYEKTYELPDGQVLTVGTERFRCPEVLFNPKHLNIDGPGFQDSLYDSVMKCDVDIRRDILDNVLLSGGNTLFPGIGRRLESELGNLCPSPVRVHCPAERRYAVWLGGSILGSISKFKEICITKSEWDEKGAEVVHQKCF